MSFILDALKKSESERQRQAGPALLEARIVRPSRRAPLWAVTVGLLLLINMAVVAWFLARSGKSPPDAASMAGATPPLTLTTPIADALPAIGEPTAGEPAGKSTASSPAVTPAAALASTSTADEANAINPADLEPATAPAAGAAPSPRSAGLRSYAELSGTLPDLRLDLHVYATNPPDRYAFINMRKVHEGDVTPEGVRVTQITREGVVLEYRGTEFVLGRE
jgi:general secretion pathway protein B